MQQQSNVTNGQKQNSILVLLLNWIIILGVYLLIRIVFIVLGFHLYTPLLGGLLAIIPYLLGTIYLWNTQGKNVSSRLDIPLRRGYPEYRNRI